MDARALHISNYWTEIEVPLREVLDVTESRWSRAHPVTITFAQETMFGREVTFIPKVRFFLFKRPESVVGEILRAAAQAKESARGGAAA